MSSNNSSSNNNTTSSNNNSSSNNSTSSNNSNIGRNYSSSNNSNQNIGKRKAGKSKKGGLTKISFKTDTLIPKILIGLVIFTIIAIVCYFLWLKYKGNNPFFPDNNEEK